MKTKYYTILALFAFAAFATFFFRVEWHAQAKGIDLVGIPAQVGEWSMLSQEKEMGKFEATFLNNVLLRTYQRPDGKTLMLAVSYGSDQKQKTSIHVPEGCYRASGFDVTTLDVVDAGLPGLTLKQMLAQKDQRTEPVQYWIVLDGKVVTNHFERKLKQVYYTLFGTRADGVLVRVSSLSADRDFARDYDMQKGFIAELYNALSPELKKLLFGDKTI